jgi:hypothetical protein
MKKALQQTSLVTLLFFLGNVSVFAQTLKDVFNNSETPILYLGIDFTKTKIIDEVNANAMDIRDRQYTSINDVVINEAKKYDIRGAFHKSFVDHDISLALQANSKINAEQIVSANTADFHRLKESDIASVVQAYNFSGKKGVGLLFVAEALSKSEKAIAVWVTLVDMSSKKILMTERIEGKVGGFGFRNYVAAGIKSVIEEIEKHKYKDWKSKYGN